MGWEFLDHTGDLGLTVEHSTLEGLFGEALRGFTHCLTDVATVGRDLRRRVELTARAIDLLLVDWLEEALYLFDTESLVFSQAVVELEADESPAGEVRLRSELLGEAFDPERHPVKASIKAVTYHGLELSRVNGGWRAQVVFDL